MKLVVGLFTASLWLVVLLSGMYWVVSADVSTDGWVGMFFLVMLSVSLACTGAVLLLWSRQYDRLRGPGWLLVACAILFWLGDGWVAGVLMVLPCLGYAAWAAWRSFVDFMSQPTDSFPASDRREP